MKGNQKYPVIEDVPQSHIISQETVELSSTDDTPHRNILTFVGRKQYHE